MENFENVLEFRDYIKQHCSKSLRENILEKEYLNKEVSTFLLAKGVDEDLCKAIQIDYSNREDNVNMFHILKAAGFNAKEIKNLMNRMNLAMPSTINKEKISSGSENKRINNILTINYDEAWRKKIFARYFNEDEKEINNSLNKIVALAGKVFADKVILDIIVDYYLPTQKYVDESVWGIAEEIIKRYKYLSFLENENTATLSGKIGKAIMNYVDNNH